MESEIGSLSSVTTLATGGDISTLRPNIVAIDVAAEPIIWFIASDTALTSNSDNSWLSPIFPSPPIIRFDITRPSSFLIISTFLPTIPEIYSISTTTLGVSNPCFISLSVVTDTTGVVILTC